MKSFCIFFLRGTGHNCLWDHELLWGPSRDLKGLWFFWRRSSYLQGIYDHWLGISQRLAAGLLASSGWVDFWSSFLSKPSRFVDLRNFSLIIPPKESDFCPNLAILYPNLWIRSFLKVCGHNCAQQTGHLDGFSVLHAEWFLHQFVGALCIIRSCSLQDFGRFVG